MWFSVTLFGFVVFTTGHFVLSCLALCFHVFSVLFSIVITSLGEERAGLCASCAFLFILHTSISILFLFLLVTEIHCSLWLWHSLDFPINFFGYLVFAAHTGHFVLTIVHQLKCYDLFYLFVISFSVLRSCTDTNIHLPRQIDRIDSAGTFCWTRLHRTSHFEV